jgi:hypothetical protein
VERGTLNPRNGDKPDTIHPQVRGTVTSCYLEVFAALCEAPLPDLAGPGVGAVGWIHASGRLSLRITIAPAGSVAEVASVPQAEHRKDGGILLADGFPEPVCDGVEITEYPVVSGQSAGSAEGNRAGASGRTNSC